jgi:endonuclease/exonuclease/phosphatase family metal-dependent hydrolase
VFGAVVVSAVCLVAVASGRPSRQVEVPPPGVPVLTVMTYNVNYGLAGDLDTLVAIRDSLAELVLLQETTPAWERVIRLFLANDYPHMVFEHSPRWAPGGMAALSKEPLHPDTPVESPVGWFFGWRLEADTPLGRVQVLNVHLRPPLSDPGRFAKGYFSTRSDRVREMDTYLATLKPGIPTFVVGDFNENEGGAALRQALDRGMDNALPAFQPGASTWRWPVGPLTARTRLDHILYEPARHHCLEAKVLHKGRSDHLPVTASFSGK